MPSEVMPTRVRERTSNTVTQRLQPSRPRLSVPSAGDRPSLFFVRRRISRMNEAELLKRITINPTIFGGKPIIRGRRLAVEHVLGMLAAGDAVEDLLRAYPWLEREDVLACLAYARRIVGHERVEGGMGR